MTTTEHDVQLFAQRIKLWFLPPQRDTCHRLAYEKVANLHAPPNNRMVPTAQIGVRLAGRGKSKVHKNLASGLFVTLSG